LTPYTKEGVDLSSVYYWVKGKNVYVVNSHRLISNAVKLSIAIFQCSQTVKVTVTISPPVVAVTMVCMGVTHPLNTGTPEHLNTRTQYQQHSSQSSDILSIAQKTVHLQ